MVEPLNLDAEADALDNHQAPGCTVCAFIASQAPSHQRSWDDLMASPRKHATVFRVLRKHGFTARSDTPVSNHRRSGHRA